MPFSYQSVLGAFSLRVFSLKSLPYHHAKRFLSTCLFLVNLVLYNKVSLGCPLPPFLSQNFLPNNFFLRTSVNQVEKVDLYIIFLKTPLKMLFI